MATKSLTCTVTATASIAYNSSTHKYTATGKAYGNAEAKETKTAESGTEAYDAGVTAGGTAAGVSGSWSGKVYTVSRSANTATKSLTCTVTATASIAYNSSTHKYTATAVANGNATARETKTAVSGTEAYDAGKAAGEPVSMSFKERVSGSNWKMNVVDASGATIVVPLNVESLKTVAGFLVGDYGSAATKASLTPGKWLIAGVSSAYDTGRAWLVPSAWIRYVDAEGSNHQGTLAAGRYVELYYSRHDGTQSGTGATWKVPESSSYTHSASLYCYEISTGASGVKTVRFSVQYSASQSVPFSTGRSYAMHW